MLAGVEGRKALNSVRRAGVEGGSSASWKRKWRSEGIRMGSQALEDVGSLWNSIQEEVWGPEHFGTKRGKWQRRQRKLFGRRLEGGQSQCKEGFVAAEELCGPEEAKSHHNAFNQENGRIWFEASFKRSLKAAQ